MSDLEYSQKIRESMISCDPLDDDGLKELNPQKPEPLKAKAKLRKRIKPQKLVQGPAWEWSDATDTNTTERNGYTCEICQKNFVSRSNLQIHSIIHSGERYKCDQCNMFFTQRCNLKRHEITHLGQKRFECSECPKKFTQKSNLQRHSAVHSGNRKFSCDTCGKKFGQKSNMKKHMTRHSPSPITLVDVECDVLFEDSSPLNP